MIAFIVPCGANKQSTPVAARNLYTSNHFQQTLAKVEAEAAESDAEVFILSAGYGLLRLDDVVAPYDTKMGDSASVSAEVIAEQALDLGIDYGSDVYAFLPSAYLKVLTAGLDALDVFPQDVYEGASGIGVHRRIVTVMSNGDLA